jgi:hypothetical protein
MLISRCHVFNNPHIHSHHTQADGSKRVKRELSSTFCLYIHNYLSFSVNLGRAQITNKSLQVKYNKGPTNHIDYRR